MTSQTTSRTSSYNLRALCAQIIFDVIEKGNSLSTAMITYSKQVADKDRALMQEISFGVMRVLPELEFYVQSLMDKVFTGKNRQIHYVLLVGIYQIVYTRIPHHAVASETVNAVLSFKKPQLKGVVNGVLRSFLRQQTPLKTQFEQQGNIQLHPNWFVKRIKEAYPQNWPMIIDANNQRPPMWLRVNQQHHTTEQYRHLLQQNSIESISDQNLTSAICLVDPVPVNKLPEFEQGSVTVQDLSAQYAAYLLAPQNGETILDLCAAPGGKTTHILEIAPQAEVLAVDIDPQRVKRINENLSRLRLHATVKVGDGTKPEEWCDGQQFDRILLDAPCSATGVIRRHPDIKWLRRDSDIDELAKLQYQILNQIWPYLKSNGILVYATCSILPNENTAQISRFLQQQTDAKLVGDTMQFLPTEKGGDGFFYAKLQKN